MGRRRSTTRLRSIAWIVSGVAVFLVMSGSPLNVAGAGANLGSAATPPALPTSATRPAAPANTSDWASIVPPSSPSARWAVPSTYDATDHEFLLFSGYNGKSLGPQTWTYANGTWTNITSTSGANPPGLDQMVYDSALGAVVGFGAPGNLPITYEFSHGKWTNVTTGTGPGPRWRSMMTYDASDGVVLLFGGENLNQTGSFNDTWRFGSTGWSQYTPTRAPPDTARGMLAWDPTLNESVLFGGFPNYGLDDYRTTWTFSQGQWTNVSTLSAPSARDGAVLSYDPNVNALVLFGGFFTASAGQGTDSDTWFFNGTWSPQHPVHAPGARALSAAGYDPDTDSLYVFGGYEFGGYPLSDSWAFYQGLSATAFANPLVTSPGTPVQFNANVSGGVGPFADVWSFGDGVSASGASASHSYAAPQVYQANVTVTDLLGNRVEGSVIVTVETQPLAITGVNASLLEPLVGESDSFSAGVVGGEPPYHLNWSFGDGGNATGNPALHGFSLPGNFTVNCSVTDVFGSMARDHLTVSVVASRLAVAFLQPPPGAASIGERLTLSVSLSGGVAPYNVTWNFGDGQVGFGVGVSHAYGQAGNLTIRVTAKDAFGFESNVSARVSVTTQMMSIGPPETSPGIPVWEWAALLVAAAVVAGTAGWALERRRRSKAVEPEAEPPPS